VKAGTVVAVLAGLAGVAGVGWLLLRSKPAAAAPKQSFPPAGASPFIPPSSSSSAPPASAAQTSSSSSAPRSGKNVLLTPGRWIAGFHAPFFISNGMVADKAAEFGFSNIRFFDRDGAAQPPFDPKLDPAYVDAWDTWAIGDYSGPAQNAELPAKPDWLLKLSGVA